jgi:hypothetical protein
MIKRILIVITLMIGVAQSAMCDTYRWAYDFTFDAPDSGRILYNSLDRLEMCWDDLTFVIQMYNNNGINDQLLKKNLARRAAEYNMYDTRTTSYERNNLKGFKLEGTMPDGSTAWICNLVSKKTGLCVQIAVNFTSTSEKTAKKLLKSVKESPAKKDKGKKKEHKKEERPRIKQKIQKKGAEPKPIKKPSASPIELYEI